MRILFMLLIAAVLAHAEANLPVSLKPLPADGLAEQLDPDVRKAMAAARARYDSKDEAKRLAAIGLFEAIPSPLADQDLFAIAEEDGWPEVRLAAAEALFRRESREAPMCAARLAVCGVPPSIRRRAALLVRRTRNVEAEEWLVLVLKHGSLRSLAGKGLGFDRSYNDLADLLYRTMAATALGHVGSELAVRELTEAFGEPAWELRSTVARALGETGDVSAIPLLIRGLADEDPDVAVESALALGRFGGGAAERALAGAAKDKRAIVAKMAARALAFARARAAAPPPPAPAAPPPPAAGGGTAPLPASPPGSVPLPEPPPQVPIAEDSLDLVFLSDATFSMSAEFPRVITQVQEAIIRATAQGDCRVGVVLFRDFDNQWLTRQHYLSWDVDRAFGWLRGEKAQGANAYAGSAADKALTVATMLNLRDTHRPHLTVFSDVPPNDLSIAVHRARVLHVFDRAVVDGVYIDRDSETRGFMTKIAEAGGGIARAYRSGAEALSRPGVRK